MRRYLALVAVLVLVASACSLPEPTAARRGGAADKPPTTSTTVFDLEETTTSTAPEAEPLTLDEQVTATIADLEVFWDAALPAAYGIAHESPNILGGYDVAVDGPPPCGDEVLEPSIAVGNAFYCPPDDTIAWDEAELFPSLYGDFGGFAVSLVLAHEWGHAIQARVGVDPTLPTIVRELQADCLAGAWAGQAMAGGVDPEGGMPGLVPVGEEELDVATAGYLLFRDPTGTEAAQPGAHGNAFDRIGAFLEGVRGGVGDCTDYPVDFPPITQTGFRSVAEAQSGGNLPAEEVFPTLSATLESYWSDTGPTLGIAWDGFDDVVAYGDEGPPACPTGYADPATVSGGIAFCPDQDVLALDGSQVLDPLYDNFGDFGPAFVFGVAWAQKALLLAGFEPATVEGRLAADCLTGNWAGSAVTGLPTGDTLPDGEPQVISLSPGDLDEAIQAILFLGDVQVGEVDAFERVEAFRLGFFGEPQDCLGG